MFNCDENRRRVRNLLRNVEHRRVEERRLSDDVGVVVDDVEAVDVVVDDVEAVDVVVDDVEAVD
eukprot:3916360-Heterocapsa_arctica.AAC.1